MAALLGMLISVTVVNPAHAGQDARPAMAPPPNVELVIEARLQNLLEPALRAAAADSQVRALVRNIVGRQFDGDTNALWSTVIEEAEESWIVDPYDPDWLSLKDAVAQFQNINGHSYDPQVYIPNWDEGIVPESTVEMVVAPADETVASARGYWLDANGQVRQTAAMIDETYAASREVWVLSVNERVIGGEPVPVAQHGVGEMEVVSAADVSAVCNPTGLRNNQGMEYLRRWRVPNRSSFGSLFEGKREMKLVVLTNAGAVLKTHYFAKVKKRNIDSWQNSDLFITTWDRAVWGDVMGYQWYEVDGGKQVSSAVSIPIQGGGSITTTVTTQERDDDGGGTAVVFSESTFLEYNTGKVRFNMCSQGGDGGTGDDNLACGAVASASSTYPGYSPARATDCNPDTRLGGAYSWANNRGTYPPNNPQWLQADFGVNKTFRRVVVYTSQGYPIRDFDVQVWNGVTFVTVASVAGNTQLSVTVTFAARTSRLIRILGRSGPNHQQTYVRVNELEVYAV